LCRSLPQYIRSASHTSLAYSTCTVLSEGRLGAFEEHSKHKVIITFMKSRAFLFLKKKELSLTGASVFILSTLKDA